MTIKELIAILEKMPNQEAQVIYQLHSEYSAMDAEEVRFVPAENEEVCYKSGMLYMRSYPRWAVGDEVYRDVCVFPGN